MTTVPLERRSLQFYWRTHLAVVAGVAIATAVLAGAFLIGESVRDSLARLAFDRLGAADVIVSAASPFPERLSADLASDRGGPSQAAVGRLTAAPLIVLEGAVAHDETGRRSSRVAVYGVDGRFWRFHRVSVSGPNGRAAFVSPGLATELGATTGDDLLVTVEAPSDIPAGLLQGRRSDRSRVLRLTLGEVLSADRMGEFAIRPTQAAVLAVFVPLQLVQRELEAEGRVNTVLLASDTATGSGEALALDAGVVERRLREGFQLEDVGVRVRMLLEPAPEENGRRSGAPARGSLAIETRTGVVSDALASGVTRVASTLGLQAVPVFSYLANTVRVGKREIPYSVVSGLDLSRYEASRAQTTPGVSVDAGLDIPEESRLWLNEWAAADVQAKPGAPASLDYFLWSDAEGLQTASVPLRVAGVVSMRSAGGDRDLIPEYPGLTGETRMSDWDPPFPVDLRRVRPRDEEYWERYRTAPKAFVTLGTAQKLWGSTHGRLTSIRLRGVSGPAEAAVVARALRDAYDPLASGALTVVPVRSEAARAAQGTTNFGEYFLYFTFFLVVSALLLTGLTFRLSVEQRLREVGLLRAVGFSRANVRSIFLREGLVIAVAGSLVGMMLALGWASLVLMGLRTWWFDAVGTDRLEVSPSWPSLVAGALAAVLASMATMWGTLASVARIAPRTLLQALEMPLGDESAGGRSAGRVRRAGSVAIVAAAAALLLCILTLGGWLGAVGGFLGSGGLALVAGVSACAAWLRRSSGRPLDAAGWWTVARLGLRGPSQRPGRATTAIALIASATFMVVSVGAFRRGADAGHGDRSSGTGGYALIGESVVPLMHDPGTRQGRDALALPLAHALLDRAHFTRLRLRGGDDASCLTLYRPTRPRVAGVPPEIVESDRFAFASSLASSDDERRRPWTLLDRATDDGTIPAIGDANSLTYVFHLGLGDTLTVDGGANGPVTLRIVGMLADSVFQSELLIGEAAFRRAFPPSDGYRLLLVEAPSDVAGPLTTLLEDRLSDYGLDMLGTTERLASFHRVENTYILAFQALGGLGLLLGTVGVGAMVLRGVLERRRELAVLLAVGYRRGHLSLMIVAECALIAGVGASVGTACAAIAVGPTLLQHGGTRSAAGILLLPALVILVALISAVAAVRTMRQLPVAATLRSE